MKIIKFNMSIESKKSFIMAERLKRLREEKGLSHDKLSKALFENYGVKISSDSLINYEVTNENHTKAYKNQGMRVEYLRCFADFYGVSADYILGQIDDPCRISSAIDDLGLTEDVVKWFARIKDSPEQNLSSTINYIMAELGFQLLMYDIIDYVAAAKAEAIYEGLYHKYFDDYHEALEKGERWDRLTVEKTRLDFSTEIQNIVKGGLFGRAVGESLNAQWHLWDGDNADSELRAYLLEAGGISVTDVAERRINKHLLMFLEDIVEKVGCEICQMNIGTTIGISTSEVASNGND